MQVNIFALFEGFINTELAWLWSHDDLQFFLRPWCHFFVVGITVAGADGAAAPSSPDDLWGLNLRLFGQLRVESRIQGPWDGRLHIVLVKRIVTIYDAKALMRTQLMLADYVLNIIRWKDT